MYGGLYKRAGADVGEADIGVGEQGEARPLRVEGAAEARVGGIGSLFQETHRVRPR